MEHGGAWRRFQLDVSFILWKVWSCLLGRSAAWEGMVVFIKKWKVGHAHPTSLTPHGHPSVRGHHPCGPVSEEDRPRVTA